MTPAFTARFTAPLYVGSALNPVNSSLIATALVPIADGLHVSAGRTAALVSSLYLASAIAQPTAGKLAEVVGPRRVFLGGIVLVLAGGVLGGVGTSLGALVAARVLIGLGTSAAYPTAMLMIRRRAEAAGLPEPPGGVLGGLQLAGTATAALGLPLGGLAVDAFGWRATFLVNVPTTLIAFALALRLPADPAIERLCPRALAARLDAPGIALFAAAMTAVLVLLDGLPSPDWRALPVALALLVALVVHERRAATPFVDVRLLARNRALSATYLRFGLASLCLYTVLYGVSDWLEAAHGLSAPEVGLLVLPMSAVSALLIRPVSTRNLVRPALLVSGVATIAGAAGLLLLGSGSSPVAIVAVTLVFGVALGTYAPANQTALYRQADAEQIGTAAGLLRTAGYVGSIASAGVVSLVFGTGVDDPGLHTAAAIMAGAALLTLLLVPRRAANVAE